MKYDKFVEFVQNSTVSCKGEENSFCVIMDSNGLVVMHDDFSVGGFAGGGNKFIGDLEPGLADNMIGEGLLVENVNDMVEYNSR